MFKSAVQIGEPTEHRGVVLVPLFPRRTPHANYVTLDEALGHGLRVTEVDAAGAVPELLVVNPLEENVLLYDGEELLGAKQNRILNLTVLVPAKSETKIPVSCVEQGRWSARSAAFTAARHTANPEVRRRKAEALAAMPLARGAAQGEVWEAVDETAHRNAVHSPTGAQSDIFAARGNELEKLEQAFPLHSGQAGVVVLLGEQVAGLDYASRPEAFALLYPKLLRGYLLEALDFVGGTPATAEAVESFFSQVTEARRSRGSSAGLGEDIRLRGKQVVGSGLALDRELIQLSAFRSEEREPGVSRIARPSLRR